MNQNIEKFREFLRLNSVTDEKIQYWMFDSIFSYIDEDNVDFFIRLIAKSDIEVSTDFWKKVNGYPDTEEGWDNIRFICSEGERLGLKPIVKKAIEILRSKQNPTTRVLLSYFKSNRN